MKSTALYAEWVFHGCVLPKHPALAISKVLARSTIKGFQRETPLIAHYPPTKLADTIKSSRIGEWPGSQQHIFSISNFSGKTQVLSLAASAVRCFPQHNWLTLLIFQVGSVTYQVGVAKFCCFFCLVKLILSEKKKLLV